jgi:hypothetical protein
MLFLLLLGLVLAQDTTTETVVETSAPEPITTVPGETSVEVTLIATPPPEETTAAPEVTLIATGPAETTQAAPSTTAHIGTTVPGPRRQAIFENSSLLCSLCFVFVFRFRFCLVPTCCGVSSHEGSVRVRDGSAVL